MFEFLNRVVIKRNGNLIECLNCVESLVETKNVEHSLSNCQRQQNNISSYLPQKDLKFYLETYHEYCSLENTPSKKLPFLIFYLLRV